MFSETNTATIKAGKIILLYGKPGIGKSTIAHGMPESMKRAHIDLEVTGFEDKQYLRIDRAMFGKAWQGSFEATIAFLGAKAIEAGCIAMVLDTIGCFEEMATSFLLKSNGWKDLEAPGYGKGHALLREEMAKITRAIVSLAQTNGLLVLCLAHTQVESLVEHDGTDRPVMSPKFGGVRAEKSPYRDTLLGNCWAIGVVRQLVSEASSTGKQTSGGIVVDFGSSPGSITKSRDERLPKIVPVDKTGASFWAAIAPLL